MERRLAAILAADVVGYSRLMGNDEEGTLVRLKAHRDDVSFLPIRERMPMARYDRPSEINCHSMSSFGTFLT